MMRLRSLRWRIVLGALFWTAGLLPISHLIFVLVAFRKPGQILTFRVGFHLALGLALLCLVAGFVEVRTGLMPFGQLRKRLSAVHDGLERRIDGSYPNEVQPLVNDLNSLLEQREKAVQRALAQAGDLAHGLKTPLAVLAQEADRADRKSTRLN